MKIIKVNLYLLSALVFAVITSVFIYTNSQSDKKKLAVADGAAQEKIIEIREKMFLSQVNDVYLNLQDYLGKTIKLEGLFKTEKPYCFVLRYGPGCCGSDGNVGFEISWDNQESENKSYPNEDDWVEAVGVLRSQEENGAVYPYLALKELNVLDKRGASNVVQ
ncbi:MAG: hypothetical protein Ta2G_01930 [Termitinemataceae bacterium]|nr:MAG: hypothetical protein Ta2G_01930 [Termitinemataceae bacterium]